MLSRENGENLEAGEGSNVQLRISAMMFGGLSELLPSDGASNKSSLEFSFNLNDKIGGMWIHTVGIGNYRLGCSVESLYGEQTSMFENREFDILDDVIGQSREYAADNLYSAPFLKG